jgi:hypothetical protein
VTLEELIQHALQAAHVLIKEKTGEEAAIHDLREISSSTLSISTTALFGAKGSGHSYFEFEWKTKSCAGRDRVKLKVRGDDNSSIEKRADIYNNFDPGLGDYFRSLHDNPYAVSANREASVLELKDSVIQKYSPLFLVCWRNTTTKVTGFATEYLWNADLMDVSEETDRWTASDIMIALDGLAHMHAHFLGKWQGIRTACPVGKFLSSNIGESVGWYRAKAESSARQDAEVFTHARVRLVN